MDRIDWNYLSMIVGIVGATVLACAMVDCTKHVNTTTSIERVESEASYRMCVDAVRDPLSCKGYHPNVSRD